MKTAISGPDVAVLCYRFTITSAFRLQSPAQQTVAQLTGQELSGCYGQCTVSQPMLCHLNCFVFLRIALWCLRCAITFDAPSFYWFHTEGWRRNTERAVVSLCILNAMMLIVVRRVIRIFPIFAFKLAVWLQLLKKKKAIANILSERNWQHY